MAPGPPPKGTVTNPAPEPQEVSESQNRRDILILSENDNKLYNDFERKYNALKLKFDQELKKQNNKIEILERRILKLEGEERTIKGSAESFKKKINGEIQRIRTKVNEVAKRG